VESERRYAAMLDGVDLLAINVALDGRLLYANDALSRLTGWSSAELLNGDWTRLVLPPDSTDIFAGLRTMAAREFPVPPRQDGIIVTRDGRKRRIRWSNAPLRSAGGDLIGITSIGEDVTPCSASRSCCSSKQAAGSTTPSATTSG
jgi:PAS domain S-box-containing protein